MTPEEKKRWNTPELESIEMFATAEKGEAGNESDCLVAGGPGSKCS